MQVHSKRSVKSYAEMTKKLHVQNLEVRGNPLTGSNLVPVGRVFDRLNLPTSQDRVSVI
jgi:hypothetical protein